MPHAAATAPTYQAPPRRDGAGNRAAGAGPSETPPRWRTVARRVVLREPRVTRDAARLGDGPEHARITVDLGCDACVAAARTDDGKWVLVGRWSYAARGFGWEFPGGPLVRGEDPRGAAAFELARCAGMRAWCWARAGNFAPMGDVLRLGCAVMAATGARADPDARREDPSVPVRLATDAQMVELIGSGAVRDGATLAAWALLKTRRA